MSAPIVSTKGRNRFALALRDEAFRLGIPVLGPPRARARAVPGDPARTGDTLHPLRTGAELYIELRRATARPEPA